MKRIKVLSIICLTVLMLVFGRCVMVEGEGYDKTLIQDVNITSNSQYANMKTNVEKTVGLVMLLFQIASVLGIIMCGVRYMFAGASKKAELKTGLVSVMIGCIIVFGASTIVTVITNSVTEITTPQQNNNGNP